MLWALQMLNTGSNHMYLSEPMQKNLFNQSINPDLIGFSAMPTEAGITFLH
jgi:hypothetical protein